MAHVCSAVCRVFSSFAGPDFVSHGRDTISAFLRCFVFAGASWATSVGGFIFVLTRSGLLPDELVPRFAEIHRVNQQANLNRGARNIEGRGPRSLRPSAPTRNGEVFTPS